MALRLESNKAFIGHREFRLGLISPPLRDGTTKLIEASSNPANPHQQNLSVSELFGVLGGMLPSGMDILIHEPHGKTPCLRTISFQNLAAGRCMQFLLCIDFANWPYRTNAIHFADAFRANLENDLSNCQSIEVSKNEYGVNITIQIILGEKSDCHEEFKITDEKIFQIYKREIAQADRPYITKPKSNESGADAGYRWWVRYVIVPIVSGGLGAAAIGWIIAHL